MINKSKEVKPKKFSLNGSNKSFDYDQWLNFFRKKSASELKQAQEELIDKIPADGYAALNRWIEILDNPSKMDKLYKGRLSKDNKKKDIMKIAVGDNDEEFYKALIEENVEQLRSSGASQQEVARLSQNINIFRKQLHESRSRKPRKGTTLEQVLKAVNETHNNKAKLVKKSSKKAKSTSVKNKETSVKLVETVNKKKTGNKSSKKVK